MVKSTGTGPAGSSMSLKDVVKEIKATNKKLDVQGTALTDFIAELKFQRQGQGLEGKREAGKKGKGSSAVPFVSPIANLSKDGLGMGFFLNPMAIITAMTSNLAGLAGGILAITAATAGLRSWALTPIKSIKKWASWGDKILDGARGIRNALFLSFGLTEAGELSRDAKGRFKKTPITTKIGMRMNSLRLSTLKAFGLDTTGKLGAAAKIDPELTKKSLFSRFKFQFGRIMNPIKNISNGIAKFASGVGKPIFAFFRTIGALGGGSLGKIAGVFGKILKPLGFFLSFKAAFDEWMLTDESNIMKQGTDFIGKFLGNFLGAPADLIKSLIFKAAEFVGFEVDDKGVFKTLKDASFEDLLTGALKNILDIPRKIFDFAVKAFTQEGFINEQFKALKDKVKEVFKGVFTGIAKVLKKAFGMEDEEEAPIESAELKRMKALNKVAKNKKLTQDRLASLRILDKNNDGIITLDEITKKGMFGYGTRQTNARDINMAFGGSAYASKNFKNLVKETGGLDLRAAEAQAKQMPIIIDNSSTTGPSMQNITNLSPSGDVSEPYSKDYMRSLFGGG